MMYQVMATVYRDQIPHDQIEEHFAQLIQERKIPAAYGRLAREYELILTDLPGWQQMIAVQALSAQNPEVYAINKDYVRTQILKLGEEPSLWRLLEADRERTGRQRVGRGVLGRDGASVPGRRAQRVQ